LIYAYDSNKYIGIEIWQVKSGTIFDNILVTDDEDVAKLYAQKTVVTQEGEKAAQAADEEEKRAKATAEAEAAQAAPAEEPFEEEELDGDFHLDLEEQQSGDQHDEL